MPNIAAMPETLTAGTWMGLRSLGYCVWVIPSAQPTKVRRSLRALSPDLVVAPPDIPGHVRDWLARARLPLLIASEGEDPDEELPTVSIRSDPITWMITVARMVPFPDAPTNSPVWLRRLIIQLVESVEMTYSVMGDGRPPDGGSAERLPAQVMNSFRFMLRLTLSRLEEQVPGAQGHAAGVANLSQRVASAIGLSTRQRRGVGFAGWVHDLGIYLLAPEEALLRPGPLREEEVEGLHEYPVVSAMIASLLSRNPEVTLAVLGQRERLDGSGYPLGTREPELSVGAQVVGLACSFDAMTRPRPYRPAMPGERALALLKEEITRGRVDPELYEPLEVAVHTPPVQAEGVRALRAPRI
jgi:HD-GYP domain-containing protein (c-di-GMP phosphodiesterase class II)